MDLIKRGFDKVKQVKVYWKKPPEGNYMTFKEIFSYSFGGFGAYTIFMVAQALLLSTTNVIIGNTIGIQPMHMYVMYIVSVVLNIPLTMVRANMVDNVKYREGKYRPYLLRMGIPTVLISLLFVFTPYGSVHYIWRCVLIFIYNFGLQFFYNFFYDAYENLIFVLSPNSQERTNVTAIKSLIYSLSPSIINFIIPLIAAKVSGGDIYDLTVYRWLYPFISVVGVGLIVLVYTGTEEKIIVPKTIPMKVKFFDALREVAKNKYFWIISLAGWLGFLETCTYIILQWLYNYAGLCTATEYAFITVLRGTAYVWGMVLAPFAIKRWGKKKVLIVTNIFNVVFLALMYPFMNSIWLIFMCVYLNSVADSFIIVLNPAIQADIRDFQHYKSGERIDGMFGAVALIGSFVTMATSSVLPAVYEKYGIFDGNGYENMYDVLYDLPILYKLVGVLIILSAVGAALNLIPYFFYDLTETKQKAVIRILKVRAMFADYGNGVLKDEDMTETMQIIRSAKESLEGGTVSIKELKTAKATKRAINKAKVKNEEYEISKLVMAEIERFSTPEEQARIIWAQNIVDNGFDGIYNLSYDDVVRAKALPKETPAERTIRKNAIADARLGVRSNRAAVKFYPNGIEPYDEKDLEELYDKDNELIKKKTELLKNKAPKTEIIAVTEEMKRISDEIKAMSKVKEHYKSATEVYHTADKLLEQARNYARFDELSDKYDSLGAARGEEIAVHLCLTKGLDFDSVPFVTDIDKADADKYRDKGNKLIHLVSSYYKRNYVGEWEVTDSGKPVSKDKCFNISHCDGAVVYVESDKNIGIDIEKPRVIKQSIVDKILSDKERQSVKSDEDFIRLWTGKESLAKCIGTGINVDVKLIPALPFAGVKEYEGKKYYSCIITAGEYVVSVTREGEEPFAPIIIEEDL